jgi:hypothetical protein
MNEEEILRVLPHFAQRGESGGARPDDGHVDPLNTAHL